MSGYRNTTSCGEPVSEHRLIVERAIGRRLQRVEHVHHKNGDIRDNRIDNLEVLYSGDHASRHHLKHPTTKECAVCGCIFEPPLKHRARAQTCSKECRDLLIGIHRRNVTPEKVKEMLWMRNEGATFKEVGDAMTSLAKNVGLTTLK